MPDQDFSQASSGIDRREFLRGMGAAVVATAALRGHGAWAPAAAAAGDGGLAATRPNILILMTDQERPPMYWPDGWAEANLPTRNRLLAHGLEFKQAFCSTAMCSPSRTTLFTGLFPAQHGVTDTLCPIGETNPRQQYLQVETQNMAKLLKAAGYNVQYRGKWHMSKGAGNTMPTAEDIAAYGFDGWVPPDAGGDVNPENFGGGCADNDQPYINQAVAFLNTANASDTTPWALIVSLVNPHDVLSYPASWDSQSPTEPTCYNYKDDAPGCFQLGIEVPPTFDESLATNYKPTAQVQAKALINGGLGVLDPVRHEPQKYVNFYAFLQKKVDAQIGTVLDALESRPGLVDNTVIVRLSDHGELGLSHGGLRQKIFNCYEEMLRVPLIISNPKLFPNPVTTTALASLIDVMPTLAALVEPANPDTFTFKGASLMPVITDAVLNPTHPTVQVQDSVLFTYDDVNVGEPGGQNVVKPPDYIRAIRTSQYKFAVYFDPSGGKDPEFELYDLQADPTELHNMADPKNKDYYNAAKVNEMQIALNARLVAAGMPPAPNRVFVPSAPRS